ncbi:IPT/TIG domain-containing protein [Chitinophaga sp. YR573]|uniref:IPT/TIG domain-containing protein n=1 Tax=Chitinophaga sp. YR573 TaxID=1881040 RepID=UPI0008B6410C|nr:IPT/TIG domain-containing protein [Chitinophaga sp. YR573]SEW25946.1 IPT/TIG domain-containing protein [Chitinophaga sp. YR573]
MKKRGSFVLVLIYTLTFIGCSKKDNVNPQTPDNDPSTLTAFTGDTITIAGKNLGTDIRTLMVKFGAVQANIIGISDTSARIVVPDDIAEAAVKIHLFSANNEFVSNFKLKAPVIRSVSPNAGSIGQQITITGNGFSKSKQISFGDKLVNAIYQSNSSLTIKVPDSIPTGKYAISVTVAGLKASAAELFNVIPFTPPTFTGFSPQTAFIGDTITLQGEHLGNNAEALRVLFGSIDATVVSASETAVRVVVPDEIEAASVKIKFGSGDAQIISANDFQLKAPVIDSIDVTSGFSGQFLNIYGKGFRKSYKTDQIVFGDKSVTANTTQPGNSEIFMTVPGNLVAGKYPVKVTVAGMTATAPDLFEVIVPTITSFTPHSGSWNTEMIITGTNLKNINGGVSASVSFVDFATGAGTYVAYIKSANANEIKLSIPNGLMEGRTYRVIVTVVSGQAQTTEPFTVE